MDSTLSTAMFSLVQAGKGEVVVFSLERHLLYRVDPMADSYEVNDTVENMTAEIFVTKMQSYGMDSTERYVQKTADKYGVDLIVETPHYGVEPTCRLLCVPYLC